METIEKFGRRSHAWRPQTFFVCSYVASPFDPLRTEKTADIGVAGFFTRRRRKDRKKAIFEIFVVGVLSVGYSLHRISDLHAKSMD